MIKGARSIKHYELVTKIHEGSYGIVYKAKERKTGDIYAVKRLKLGEVEYGMPISTLREISVLARIDHPNLVKVREVVVGAEISQLFVVMEFGNYELK